MSSPPHEDSRGRPVERNPSARDEARSRKRAHQHWSSPPHARGRPVETLNRLHIYRERDGTATAATTTTTTTTSIDGDEVDESHEEGDEGDSSEEQEEECIHGGWRSATEALPWPIPTQTETIVLMNRCQHLTDERAVRGSSASASSSTAIGEMVRENDAILVMQPSW